MSSESNNKELKKSKIKKLEMELESLKKQTEAQILKRKMMKEAHEKQVDQLSQVKTKLKALIKEAKTVNATVRNVDNIIKEYSNFDETNSNLLEKGAASAITENVNLFMKLLQLNNEELLKEDDIKTNVRKLCERVDFEKQQLQTAKIGEKNLNHMLNYLKLECELEDEDINFIKNVVIVHPDSTCDRSTTQEEYSSFDIKFSSTPS